MSEKRSPEKIVKEIKRKTRRVREMWQGDPDGVAVAEDTDTETREVLQSRSTRAGRRANQAGHVQRKCPLVLV